ncbi:MAG TPA: hypothetical protein PLM53_11155 [Spirochaetota bacterium]|nr:hypothetical protein [Spirochaetota bacterium]HPC41506.1 hypothetical protein [Spirochaetota bacterium]HPL15607.1 hypothetical protein [Spirochaetota bacterium]HQF09126.1 hypothetical protein [Spirochaetota bacterium]HQH97649.1 hypothetical protein [Spirochaetota bacterium]
MRAGLTWCVLAFFLFAAPFSSLASAETGGLAVRQKRFIRDLFSQKRYFDVISETRRLMALDPAGDDRKDYSFFIDVNYFLGRQYRTVVTNITSRPGPPDCRTGILLSQSYLMLGMNGRSLEAALRVRYDAVEGPGRYPLLARRAEAYLECGRYRELLDEIRAAGRYVPDRARVALLREEVERFRHVPLKSVPLAVALSVFFPGAGQMYAGKWVHGVVSFIGVASLAGGACLLHRQGNRHLSYAFMAFTSVFYLGTIYGAYNAAQTTNEDLHRTFRDGIKKKCIPAYDPAGEVRDTGVFR